MKKKEYNFSIFQKTYFYFCYVYYRILIPWDCKKGRLSLIIAEIIFMIGELLKRKIKSIKIQVPNKFRSSEFVTKFGIFTIDDSEITNTIITSPAFERLDKEFLLSLIKKEIEQNKKVLFIDVGAHIGTYSIMVANAFRQEKRLFIYAFEPESTEFTGESFSLLKKNVRDNKITNIKLFHIGLGSKNTKTLNKVGIMTRKLDSTIKPSTAKKYDAIFIKIDIEGYEKEALEGAKKILDKTQKAILLIEDYIDKDIVNYLEKNYVFYKKLTPYNAFWIRDKSGI